MFRAASPNIKLLIVCLDYPPGVLRVVEVVKAATSPQLARLARPHRLGTRIFLDGSLKKTVERLRGWRRSNSASLAKAGADPTLDR